MPQEPFDDPHYAYHDDRSHNDDPEESEELIKLKEKFQTLEKRVKAIEVNDIFGATAMDMCLVSDLIIPTKFKLSDFKKYKGNTSPRNHLLMYY